jgi:NAD(P)-dependent dehydrogenase (short-subunit alcohol dehydrogenase family)
VSDPERVPGQNGAECIKGRVVLVTGSGRGLGAAVARAAAARGARVVLNCRANGKPTDGLVEEITRGGGQALLCRGDVSDYEEARRVVDETLRVYGAVDVLVNTVGCFTWKPVAEMEPAEWRRVMASNVDSVYHMCRLALPTMRRNHWGRIVNLATVGAEQTVAQSKVSAYSAAKAAVVAFSKALALEEARCGITVNVVSPGAFMEDGDARRAPEAAHLEDRVPVGRTGEAEDLVRAILFFTSPAAGFLTGQVLSVAGGWRL